MTLSLYFGSFILEAVGIGISVYDLGRLAKAVRRYGNDLAQALVEVDYISAIEEERVEKRPDSPESFDERMGQVEREILNLRQDLTRSEQRVRVDLENRLIPLATLAERLRDLSKFVVENLGPYGRRRLYYLGPLLLVLGVLLGLIADVLSI